VKHSILWAIIALLLGVVLFGAITTYFLLKKQAELSASIDKLDKELQDSQTALSKANDQIDEGNLLKSQLQEELQGYKSKLTLAEKKLDQYREYARLIRDKMNNAAEMNEALAGRNREINNKLVRSELENQELRQKFDDPAFLKQALKELNARDKKAPRAPASKKQPARKPVRKKPAAKNVPRKILKLPQDERTLLPVATPAEGNEGFVIRDGKSTFSGLVDIQVLPAEPAADRA
jgi:hypothetical protein